MPGFLNAAMNALANSAQKETTENVRFLENVLGSLKLMTLMLARMQPIPDNAAKLASTEYSVNDIQLGAAIVVRLYYNQIFGIPPGFNYDLSKLHIIYSTYDFVWDEPVPPPS